MIREFHDRKTPGQEIEKRISALKQALEQARVDLAVVVQSVDLFYFTGTIQRGYLLVPREGNPLFAVTGNLDRVREESAIGAIEPISSLKDVPRLCSHMSIGSQPSTLGLEFDVLPVSIFNRITALFPSARPVDISSAIKTIRMVKSPYEIEKIRASATILPEALSHLPDVVRQGMTEVELQSEIIKIARRRSHFGAHRVRGFNQESYYGHVLAGARGAVPSMINSPTGGLGSTPAFGYGAGHWPIDVNSPILIDLCFGIDGYLSDQTRTAVVGKLPRPLAQAYEQILVIKTEIEKLLRPGAICEEIYFHVLEKAEGLGIAENFMGFGQRRARFVGHGIGLEMDEWPVIGKGFQVRLAPGVEPKAVFPGLGAIGLEDNYVITEAGYENITPMDESIIEVIP